MTNADQPSRVWLGIAEILFIHAVLLAILLWIIWESVTELQPRDRALPMTTAVIVTGVLFYNLASRLWKGKKDEDVGGGDEQASAADMYGTFTTDLLSARHLYAIVAFTLYVFLTPLLNLYLVTGIFVVGLSIALRAPVIGIVAGVVLALAIPALFQFGLEMQLP